MKNNVGHAEVAERPCEGGYYLESAELAGLGGLNAGGRGHAEVAGDGLGVCNDVFPAADGVDAEDEDDRQSKDHYKALHKARYRRCLEAAACGVCYDYGSAYYHGGNVVISEQSSEKLAAGREAGSCVGNVENDDGYGAYKLDELGVIVEAAGYVLGQSQRAQPHRVAAQALCNEQPVEIGAKRKADSRPARFRDAAEERQSGNAHEQICAHVRSFGGKRRHDRAELAAAEVKLVCVGLALGIVNADGDHTNKVDHNGDQYANNITCHVSLSNHF